MSMMAMLLTTASNEAGSPSARRASSSIASAFRYFDLSAVRTSPLEHRLAEVDCKHPPAELGHPASELAVPARDLEDPLSLLEPKEPFDRRLDEMSLPGSSGLHVLVPKGGQLVPRGTDIVVQVEFLAHTAKRIRPSVAVSRIAMDSDAVAS
jgi:hypothetical protein